MLGVAVLTITAVGVWKAARTPPLRDIKIVIPDLPRRFEGYTLVQLTDLHISRLFPRAWTVAVVAATNRLRADLVVITGDVIDGSVANRRLDVEPPRIAGWRWRVSDPRQPRISVRLTHHACFSGAEVRSLTSLRRLFEGRAHAGVTGTS